MASPHSSRTLDSPFPEIRSSKIRSSKRQSTNSAAPGVFATSAQAWNRSFSITTDVPTSTPPSFELDLRAGWFPSFDDTKDEMEYLLERDNAVRKAAFECSVVLLLLTLIEFCGRQLWAADDLAEYLITAVIVVRFFLIIFFVRLFSSQTWHDGPSMSLRRLSFGGSVLSLLCMISLSLLLTELDRIRNILGLSGRNDRCDAVNTGDSIMLLGFLALQAIANLLRVSSLYVLILLIVQILELIFVTVADLIFCTVWHSLTCTCIFCVASYFFWQASYRNDVSEHKHYREICKNKALVTANEHKTEMEKRLTEGRKDGSQFIEKSEELTSMIQQAIATGDQQTLSFTSERLQSFGWKKSDVDLHIKMEEKRQSEEGGICLAFLISGEFLKLVHDMTGMEDPTFHDLKDLLWKGEQAIGKHMICPRDGLPGCALIDALPRKYRGTCTHYLSWTWSYRVSMFLSSLNEWVQRDPNMDPHSTFLFVCFFCNNQFRILVAGSSNGSDDLEFIFESRLRKIQHVVAMLDKWDMPVYLTRIWTIYEQFVAAKLEIDVTMLLPPVAQSSLVNILEGGKEGIEEVRRSLMSVNSEKARAYFKNDEDKVKSMIREGIGFDAVDRAVACSLIEWVGKVVQKHFHSLVNGTSDKLQTPTIEAI